MAWQTSTDDVFNTDNNIADLEADLGELDPVRRLESHEQGMDLRDLLRVLHRRKMVIIGTIVVLMTLAIIVVKNMTPIYTAITTLMFENREAKVVEDIEAVLSGLSPDFSTLLTESEVIQSRGMAEKMIKRMHLGSNPDFNPALKLRDPGDGLFVSLLTQLKLKDSFETVSEFLSFGSKEKTPLSEKERQEIEQIQLIATFLASLNVIPSRESRILRISFRSSDPQLAKEVVNTIANLYLVEQLEVKFAETERVTKWLDSRMAGLRDQVRNAERAVEAYRKKSGLVETKSGTTIAMQQLSEINKQLIIARAKRTEAEVRLRQVGRLVESAESPESIGEVLNSPLIQGLRQKEADLLRKMAELSATYGDRHPRMINVRAEISNMNRKINVEIKKIVQSLKNEVSVAGAQEASLKKAVKKLEIKVGHLNSSQIELRALSREATANRAVLENFLSRFKETSVQSDIQRPDARVISWANTPQSPSHPKGQLIIFLVLVTSTVFGVVLAFAIDSLDQGFRGIAQLEKLTGIPAVAMIPEVRAATKNLSKFINNKPGSSLAESIRTVFTSLIIKTKDTKRQIVLITSSLPAEGKTGLSLALAKIAAESGLRTVVVEFDMRRPSFNKILNLPKDKKGLVDVLTNQALLKDVIHHDQNLNVYYICSGSSVANFMGLLVSERLESIFDELKNAFDLVIVDSPPVLAVNDTRIFSTIADQTIFVVRWGATPRKVVASGLKQILDAGAKLSGTVLSRVNMKKSAGYGYGDSGYYYGNYKNYYTH